jgi:hypothetical protein
MAAGFDSETTLGPQRTSREQRNGGSYGHVSGATDGSAVEGLHMSAGAFATRAAIFLGLLAFYLLTAPWYHTTAVDSYDFAHLITEVGYLGASTRLFLWQVSMHALYDIVSWVLPDPDPFVVVGVANAAATSAAVLLLQRLLRIHLGLSPEGSWLTAGLFALSYGTWRYATEFEVYAFAALYSLIVLHLAFRSDHVPPAGRTAAILVAAVFGTFATLSYQPLGIVAGFVVPTYLLLRLGVRSTALYLASYAALVGVGMLVVRMLKSGSILSNADGLLDTDGKMPSLPGLSDLGLAWVAFAQNLLSVNWMFMFEPTRRVLEERYRDRFIQELVASDQTYAGDTLYVLTLPVAAALVVLSLALVLRRTRQRPVSAAELCAYVWLGIHAAMSLSLHPAGFETWLPALVPALMILGVRVVDPLVLSGWRLLPALTLVTLAVHNWFAGVGFFAMADRDYNVARGDPILAVAGAGDVMVVGRNWAFERYLNYQGEAKTYLISRQGREGLGELAVATLSGGGRVFLFDDVFVEFPGALESMGAAVDPPGGDRRIDLGELGYAVIVE